MVIMVVYLKFFAPLKGIDLRNSVVWESEALEPWLTHTVAPGACPGFCNMRRVGVFLLPLDVMLVRRNSLPHNLLGTHLYTWVERGTVRVKCLAQ